MSGKNSEDQPAAERNSGSVCGGASGTAATPTNNLKPTEAETLAVAMSEASDHPKGNPEGDTASL